MKNLTETQVKILENLYNEVAWPLNELVQILDHYTGVDEFDESFSKAVKRAQDDMGKALGTLFALTDLKDDVEPLE